MFDIFSINNEALFNYIKNIEDLRSLMQKFEHLPKENDLYIESSSMLGNKPTYEVALYKLMQDIKLIEEQNLKHNPKDDLFESENFQILEIITKAPEIINHFIFYTINKNQLKPESLNYYEEIFALEIKDNQISSQPDFISKEIKSDQSVKIYVKMHQEIIGEKDITTFCIFKEKFTNYVVQLIKTLLKKEKVAIDLLYLNDLIKNAREIPFNQEDHSFHLEKEKKYYLNKLEHVSMGAYCIMHIIKIFYDLTYTEKYIPLTIKINKILHHTRFKLNENNANIEIDDLYLMYNEILFNIKKKQCNFIIRILHSIIDFVFSKYESLNVKIEHFNIIVKKYRQLIYNI